MEHIDNILTYKGGDRMTQQTYNTMLEELKEQKAVLIETIEKSKQVINEHTQIINEAEQKLTELGNGMQFISKWFLHETVEQEEKNLQSTLSEMAVEDVPRLDNTVKSVLDNQSDRKFTAREVTEILQSKNYPTRASSFIDVVSNTLRTLAREGKIGHRKKSGKKVIKYFSLLNQRGNGGELIENLTGRRKLLYTKAEN
jgi:hypothetical protein